MKKLFMLSIVSILFYQCNEDSSTNPLTSLDDVVLLSIEVENDYIRDNIIMHAYLSDDNGEIITDTPLANESTVELIAAFDPNQQYHLTLLTNYTDLDRKIFKTFTNIDNQTLRLKNESSGYNIITEGKCSLIINNVPSYQEVGMSSGGNVGYSSFTNQIDIEVELEQVNKSAFILIEDESNDDPPKYIWRENIYDGYSEEILFDDLKEIENVVTLDFPSNALVNYQNIGIVDDIYFSYFYDDHYIDNTPVGGISKDLFFPEDVFDSFHHSMVVRTEDYYYKVNRNTEDLNKIEFNEPVFDYEIINSSLSDFEMTSISGYDFYSVTFDYQEEENEIYWTIKGKNGGNIQFNLPELENISLDNYSISGEPEWTNFENEVAYFDFISEDMEWYIDYLDTHHELKVEITKR